MSLCVHAYAFVKILTLISTLFSNTIILFACSTERIATFKIICVSLKHLAPPRSEKPSLYGEVNLPKIIAPSCSVTFLELNATFLQFYIITNRQKLLVNLLNRLLQ